MNERAQRIREFLGSQVGHEIMAILDEMAREPKDELWEIMAKKPDTLTGKTALKYAIRSKALTDFKEALADEARAATPK